MTGEPKPSPETKFTRQGVKLEELFLLASVGEEVFDAVMAERKAEVTSAKSVPGSDGTGDE
jgi:hypothetical protein